MFGRFVQALFAGNHRSNLAGQTDFTKHHQISGQRPIPKARKHRREQGKIRPGLTYTHAANDVDEHILTLGGEPLHSFSDYLSNTDLSESKGVTDGIEGVRITVQNFSELISKERSILALASDAADEGTVSQMSDYITETEKTLWMLNAYLS